MNAHQRRIEKRKLIARAKELGVTLRPHEPLWRIRYDVRSKEMKLAKEAGT